VALFDHSRLINALSEIISTVSGGGGGIGILKPELKLL